MPLAEIAALLDADPERFATALADVERHLTDRIEELIDRRRTLRRLACGDRVLLPDRAGALLDRLADLGFSPDYAAIQRETPVFVRALMPEGFDDFLSQYVHRLDDPEYDDLLKRCWEAESWDPEDPQVEELATALSDNLPANRELLAMSAAGLQARPEAHDVSDGDAAGPSSDEPPAP